MNRMAVLLVIGLSSAAFGTTKAYDVTVYSDCVAVTPPNTPVVQYYRNTVDSITSVSVWLGPAYTSGSYQVEVDDSAGGRIAYSATPVEPTSNWGWVNFPMTKDTQPVRGRTYKVVVTRQNNGPITFGYDPRNPYRYGKAVVSGSTMPDGSDLALRVLGLHDVVDSTDFGADDVSWWASLDSTGSLTFDTTQFRNDVESSKVRAVRFDLDWNLVQYNGKDCWHLCPN